MRDAADPDFATQSHGGADGGARRRHGGGARRCRGAMAARSARWRSTPPGRPSSRSAPDWSRSTTTTSGATIAPPPRRRGSPKWRTRWGCRRSACLRRRVLVGVGLRQAAPLAAPQPGASRGIRHGAGALRPRGGAVLCGITDPHQVPRSICAMGHKWLWSAADGGLPPEEFLVRVDPLLAGIRATLDGRYATSDQLAGTPVRRMGGAARAPARHSDSGRGVRRALGRHRRRHRRRRRRQRGRDGDVRHGDRARAVGDPGRLRHRAGLDPSASSSASRRVSPPWGTSSSRRRGAPTPRWRN